MYTTSSDDSSGYLATASDDSSDNQSLASSTKSVGIDSNLSSLSSSDSAHFEKDLEDSISSDVYETPGSEHNSSDSDELAAEDDIATVSESSAAVYEGAKRTYVEVALLLVQYSLRYSLHTNSLTMMIMTILYPPTGKGRGFDQFQIKMPLPWSNAVIKCHCTFHPISPYYLLPLIWGHFF